MAPSGPATSARTCSSHATQAERLKDAAGPELASAARAHGLSAEGSPSRVAARIFDAYVDGTFPEDEVCALMSWCYAGFTVDELGTFARDALAAKDIGARLNVRLTPILEWARAEGVRAVIVSASPAAGGRRSRRSLRVLARRRRRGAPRARGRSARPAASTACCRSPTVSAWRPPELLKGDELLAAFGDNYFDLELLRAARLGVAVSPKPALRERLPELEDVVLLEPDQSSNF